MIGTAASLHAKASAITGLSDFGEDDYSDGLAVLLESFERDAGLTEYGQRAARALLRGALVARLLSEAGFRANPSFASVPVTRPIFVTGLPRTGTTFLHRLLVADPAHQGLELWLAEAPQPRPPREQWAENPAYQFVAAGIARHRAANPSFGAVHELGAGQVEECWQLLRQSMRSVSFECLAHLPTYSAWLAGQDWLGPYRRHRRNLQLLGLNDVGRRWVLKNPSHLFALDALMTVYPDALVIVTHREPRIALASMCSLAAQASAGWSTTFTGPVIGRDQLALWAAGAARFTAARARYPAERFVDIGYQGLVADPMRAIEHVYASFGMELSGAAADAMRTLVKPSADVAPADGGGGNGGRLDGRPAHRYSLADFGLGPEDVDAIVVGALGVPRVDDGADPSGFDLEDVAGDAHLRRERRRPEQALDIRLHCCVRVGDRTGLKLRFLLAGRFGGIAPELRVGEKAGSALGMVHDRDLEEPVVSELALENLPGQEAEKGDVVDDGLVDTAAGVADDRSVAEPEPQKERGVDPVVQARDDDQPSGWRGERRGRVAAGELLVALKQRGHPGHGGRVPFQRCA